MWPMQTMTACVCITYPDTSTIGATWWQMRKPNTRETGDNQATATGKTVHLEFEGREVNRPLVFVVLHISPGVPLKTNGTQQMSKLCQAPLPQRFALVTPNAPCDGEILEF